MALWCFFLLAFFTAAESQPVKQNNQNDLLTAMTDMRTQSYNGFVILLQLLNNSDFLQHTEITFLMPSDKELSQVELNSGNLNDFVLSHSIPTSLMINHMMHFPNRTMVPSSIPKRMFTITKAGRSELFLNDAKIVSPDVCLNSRISCHGISKVIAFNGNSSLSPPLRENGRGKSSLPSSLPVEPVELPVKLHARSKEAAKGNGRAKSSLSVHQKKITSRR